MQSKLWTASFIKISFSSFFVFLAFYILATGMSLYVTENLAGTDSQAGLAMAIFIIAAVLVRPFAGQIMQRYGVKKVAFVALLTYLIISISYFAVLGFTVLLVIRFLHGGSFAISTTVTNTAAIHFIPDHRKGEGISYFSLFMSMAMVIGPYLGVTITNKWGFTAVFAICAVCSLLAYVLGVSAFRTSSNSTAEAAPSEQTAQATSSSASSRKRMFNVRDMVERHAVPISLSGFIIAFSYSGLITFISIYAKEQGLADIAGYYFVFFGLMIILPRPIIGKMIDRYDKSYIVYPSIVIFALGMLLLSMANTPTMLLLSGAVAGLGYGAMLPCLQTIAIMAAKPERRGLATATFYLLFDLGYGIGSFSLGSIASSFSYSTMYVICAIVILFSAVCYYLLHHKRQSKSAAPSYKQAT